MTLSLKSHIRNLLLLVLLTGVSFYGTLSTPWLYDDDHAVVHNAATQTLEIYPQAFHPDNLFNRPVLQFTFALNRELGGLNVQGYHLVNIGLHAVVGVVFYILLLDLLCLVPENRRAAWSRLPLWAAALHLVHPLAVEPVAYLSSRSSLLATLFYLLGLLCLVRFYKRTSDTGLGGLELLAGFAVFFYLGCGTKAIIVTLPVMAVVFLAFKDSKHFFEKRGQEALLILAPALVYLFWRTTQLGSAINLPGDPSSAHMSRLLYGLTQIKEFTFYYLLKYCFPINQNFEPDVRLVSGFSDAGIWISLIVIGLAAFAIRRYTPRLLWFGAVWSLVTLLPTSSVVPLKQIVTEHRFYLPGLGMSLLVAGLFLMAAQRFSRAGLGFAGLLLLCFVLTQNRIQDFQSALSLWEDTARKSPNKALVHNNLATVYLELKQLEDAEQSLKTTLQLNPQHSQARTNLGVMYAQQGQMEQAVTEFLSLVKSGSSAPVVFFNAGLALKNLDRPADALPLLEQANNLKPDNAQYLFTLGQVYQLLKRNDDALLAYRKSLKLEPENFQAQLNMGTVFWSQGHHFFADSAFQRAYALAPESTVVLSNLVSSNMVFQNYDQAIRYLKEWLKLDPENSSAQQYLIAAQRLKETPK